MERAISTQVMLSVKQHSHLYVAGVYSTELKNRLRCRLLTLPLSVFQSELLLMVSFALMIVASSHGRHQSIGVQVLLALWRLLPMWLVLACQSTGVVCSAFCPCGHNWSVGAAWITTFPAHVVGAYLLKYSTLFAHAICYLIYLEWLNLHQTNVIRLLLLQLRVTFTCFHFSLWTSCIGLLILGLQKITQNFYHCPQDIQR